MMLWRLGPERAAEWRDIRLEALLLDGDAFGAHHADWRDRPLSDFASRLEQMRHFAAGEAIGAPLAIACWEAGMDPSDPCRGWVMSVYARPLARGRGYAQAVLHRIARDAAQSGMRSLGLHVRDDNHHARALYDRIGFRAVGPAPRPAPDSAAETVMHLPLDMPQRGAERQ